MRTTLRVGVSISCVLAIAIIGQGCTNYHVGGQKYSSQEEATAAHMKLLADGLDACVTADTTAGDRCILVIPSRDWLRDNYVTKKGAGLDFVLASLERNIANQYAAIDKSGLFQKCHIVKAKRGNGEGEAFADEQSFEIRAELREEDRSSVYRLFGPGGTNSKVIGSADVNRFCMQGWDWMADAIRKVAVSQ